MSTVLVTGASSGIGLQLAKQFADGGYDLVLVARSEGKLQELAERLTERHRVTATVISIDLSQISAVDELCKQLQQQSIEVDTLVNNAGFGALGKFAELSAERQTSMLMVNVVALTRLTRLLLPGMLERGRGGVLNVGSTAAYQAGPYMSVYYASKAYVMSFTEGLREELADSALHVTCLQPGPTKSDFGEQSGMSRLKMFSSSTMSAEAVARAGYLGYQADRAVVIPGWRNWLMASGTGFLPRFLTRKVVAKMQMPDD